jgi:hypothetical protein
MGTVNKDNFGRAFTKKFVILVVYKNADNRKLKNLSTMKQDHCMLCEIQVMH